MTNPPEQPRTARRRPRRVLGAVDDLPLPGYVRLDVGQTIARLPRFSQVELTAVESYKRTHANRVDVLNKLRYLRAPEPVDGYDGLEPEEIVAGLGPADSRHGRITEQGRAHPRGMPSQPAPAIKVLGFTANTSTMCQGRSPTSRLFAS